MYKTAIVENTWIRCNQHGWGNGYVIIPVGHPLHGVNYETINDFVSVHGGLTYSEYCTEKNKDIYGLDDSDLGKWIVGFDTAHYGDSQERWHKAAVQAETDFLLTQIVGLSDKVLD